MPKDLEQRLREDDGSTFTHVSMIHHETTAGVINPLSEICDVMLRFPNVELIVDSMSGFGAYEVDLGGRHSPCKYLVSSACCVSVPTVGLPDQNRSQQASTPLTETRADLAQTSHSCNRLPVHSGQLRRSC